MALDYGPAKGHHSAYDSNDVFTDSIPERDHGIRFPVFDDGKGKDVFYDKPIYDDGNS